MLDDIDAANNLVELFLKRADEKGDKPFLGAKKDGSWQTISWREAAERVCLLAENLRGLGLESGDRVVVGVNAYQSDLPAYIQPQQVDPTRVSSQLAGLARVRAERDNAKSEMSLQRLEKAALDSSANMMEAILETVEAYATLGEICDTLRDVFGQYRQET